MFNHSQKVTNVQRRNLWKPMAQSRQIFISSPSLTSNRNLLLNVKAQPLSHHKVCRPSAFIPKAFSHAPSFQGAMRACRMRRRLLYGQLRYPRQRSFDHFLLLVIHWCMRKPSRMPFPPTIVIPRPLLLQPQLPLIRLPPLSSPLLLVRPSALLKSSLKLPLLLEVSPISLVHLHRLRTIREELMPCLRIAEVVVRSMLPPQRHLVHPVRGPQRPRLHVRRLPSLLQLRLHRLSCRVHGQIRFLRLRLPMDKCPLYHTLLRLPAQAHSPYEHLRHLGAGFRRLVHFVGKA
jgi:hypothetical protein